MYNSDYSKTKSQKLYDIRKVASWKNDSLLEQLTKDFLNQYSHNPNATKEIDEAVAAGRIFGEVKQKASKTAYSMGYKGERLEIFERRMNAYHQELEDALKKLYNRRGNVKHVNGFTEGDSKHFRNSYKKGAEARSRSEENKRRPPEDWNSFAAADSQDGVSRSEIHKNSLAALSPSRHWMVMIDETGTAFTDDSFREIGAPDYCGRIVGVFIPENASLKELPSGWHSSDLDYDAVRGAAKDLVDSPCGVLGVSAALLNWIHGHHWLYGIEALLDLAVRLLPLDGDTVIDVFVEQREDYDKKNSFLLQDRLENVLSRLARSFPQQAGKITLRGYFISKEGHPYNGYADTAAFLWGGSSVQNILKSTKWLGSCFLQVPADKLRDALDMMERWGDLPPQMWTQFLNSSEARQANSLVSALLKKLGEETHLDPRRWRVYVDYTLDHLNSKAIRLGTLDHQIEWLQKYAPEGEALPPRLRLLWLTAILANQNHHGGIQSEEERKEFQKFSEELYEEDAPLVCNAALHLAVSYTNSYEFQRAEETLADWDKKAVEIPGRRYYAQTRSALGQIKAFQGDHQGALKDLREALAEFQKLSDPKERESEISQTSAYLVIELMDNQPNAPEFLEAFQTYLGGSLVEAAQRFALSDRAEDKYRHHILLRYLVSGNANSEEANQARQIYLQQRGAWQVGEGHPWELIEFYRALLLDSSQADLKIKRLQNAFDLAKEEPGVLRVIAAVIAAALLEFDAIKLGDYQTLVENISQKLPALGERIESLREQPTKKRDILPLAERVLPFNFR